MILFFALAAVICLQGFSKAHEISSTQQQMDQAVVAAQNAAEVMKHTHGDLDAAAQLLEGSRKGDEANVYYDEAWQPATQENAAFVLRIRLIPDDTPLLGTADIQVLIGENAIFQLTVSWQEVQ